MPSPFSMFRKHERVLMVALTVMAMVAFVFFDQLTPDQVPAILGMLAGAALFWTLGAQTGRGWIYAIAGGILGLILGFFVPSLYGPQPVVTTAAGDLGGQELYDMVTRRQRVNEFIFQAQMRSMDEEQMFQQPERAYFGNPGQEEVVRTWLLNKEADELGIHLSDDAVIDFIKEVTGNRLTAEDFIAVRNRLGMSESQLLEALKYELRAYMALRMLLPNLYPTPEQYWELYKRLNVTTDLAIAEVPVEAFVDEKEEPSQQQLVEFFEKYRAVAPNQLGPGEPGFYQPRRVQFAYLEADFDTLKEQRQDLVPTEEEVLAYYERNKESLYRQFPRETPGANPFTPGTPGESEQFPGDDGPVEAPKPEATEPAPPLSPPTLPTGEEPQGEAAIRNRDLSDVVAVDPDQIATFAVSAETPEEQPAADAEPDAPPAGDDAAPAADEAAAPTLPELPGPGEQPTVPAEDPLPEYRPFEEVRDEIREQLHDQRVREALAKKISEAQSFMYDLGRRHQAPPEAGEEKLTAKEVSERLKEYAKEQNLRYVVSSLVSEEELNDPDKYPISLATDPVEDPSGRQNAQTLAQHLFGTGPDVLYNPFIVETPLDQNRYAVWKIADKAGHLPDFAEVKDQVLEAWRIQQARPEAEKRAQELAKSVGPEQELSEALEGKTLTGQPQGRPLNVQQTEPFTWLRRLSAPQENPFAPPVVELSSISAVENAGEDFMKTVFNQVDVGEVGVAPNADRSAYYIVQVKSRTPSDEEGLARLRESFMREDLFGRSLFGMTMPTAYEMVLGARQQQIYQDWLERFSEKYAIQWLQQQNQPELVN